MRCAGCAYKQRRAWFKWSKPAQLNWDRYVQTTKQKHTRASHRNYRRPSYNKNQSHNSTEHKQSYKLVLQSCLRQEVEYERITAKHISFCGIMLFSLTFQPQLRICLVVRPESEDHIGYEMDLRVRFLFVLYCFSRRINLYVMMKSS